jgi:uncharacterized protein (DUF427 family)
MRDWLHEARGQLCHEPTEQRVRARIGGTDVVDSARALLVWEPRRVVPSYAVPVWDLRGDLTPAPRSAETVSGILHPGIGFGVHSCPGEVFDLAVAGTTRPGAAFRPADPDLDGYVVLDFTAFDSWLADDETLLAHPRDPYHRVETRRGSGRVRIELDGVVLAESSRAVLVYETQLPVRFYLPADDVVGGRPSPTRTVCGYKGEAAYWSFGDRADLAWSYAEPLPGVEALRGMVGFYDDLLDVFVDGRVRNRPRTAVSKALLEEFGKV